MREKKGMPLSDVQGRIRVDTVNALGFDTLLRWIDLVLHREDPAAGADRFDLPHGFLGQIYRQLDPQVRTCFEDSVLTLLSELSHRRNAKWTGEAADELLLLVATIFQDSLRMRAPVESLRYFIEQSSFDGGIDLRWRALQTLVALGHRAEADFWRRHYGKNRGEYALVTFGGLAIRSVAEAFSWMELEAGDEHVFSALLSRLPLLVEKFGVDYIAPFVRKLVRFLPSSQRSRLAALALRLDIDISGEPFLGIFGGWQDWEIKEFGRQLDICWPQAASSSEIRESIMSYLVAAFEERAEFQLGQRNARAIIAAIWCTQEKFERISSSIVDQVIKFTEMLENFDIGSEDLRLQVFSAVTVLRSKGIDAYAVYREKALSYV